MQPLGALTFQTNEIPVWNGNPAGVSTANFLALLLSGVETPSVTGDRPSPGLATGGRERGREFPHSRAAEESPEPEPVPGALPFINPGFPLQPPLPSSALELNPLRFSAGGPAATQPAESAEPDASLEKESGTRVSGQSRVVSLASRLQLSTPELAAPRSSASKTLDPSGTITSLGQPEVEPPASPRRTRNEPGPLTNQPIEAAPAIAAPLNATSSVSQPGASDPAPLDPEDDRPPMRSTDLKASEQHQASEVSRTDAAGDVAFRMRLSYREPSHGPVLDTGTRVIQAERPRVALPDLQGWRNPIGGAPRLPERSEATRQGPDEDARAVPAAQTKDGESRNSGGPGSDRDSSGQAGGAASDRKTRSRDPETSNDVEFAPAAASSNVRQGSIEHSPLTGAQASSSMGRETRMRSESPSPAPPATPDAPVEAPKAAPLRELSLKLPGNAGAGVDLHVVDNKGKLHVEVRTSDAHLASSLQDNVGDLVGKLDRSGYQTEELATSRDGRVAGAPGHSQQSDNDDGRQSGAERDQTAGQGGQSGQQHHQGQGRGNRPRWLEEIVKNFDPQVREEENQH